MSTLPCVQGADTVRTLCRHCSVCRACKEQCLHSALSADHVQISVHTLLCLHSVYRAVSALCSACRTCTEKSLHSALSAECVQSSFHTLLYPQTMYREVSALCSVYRVCTEQCLDSALSQTMYRACPEKSLHLFR